MTCGVDVAQSGTRRHGAAENTALAAVCGPWKPPDFRVANLPSRHSNVPSFRGA
jgi:hypothetical protein